MSAFVVSRFDIDILVTAIADLCGPGARYFNLNRLGRDLWRENIESVAYRYQLRGLGRPKRSDGRAELARYLCEARAYAFTRRKATDAAIAKIARCYDYQSCEHPGYEASHASQLANLLMARFPETLPGYDDAPWGITGCRDLMAAGCEAAVDRQGKLY